MTETDKNEISSPDSQKSFGPSSIPVKILKLLKNDISQQLSDILNMLFITGKFTSVLKIAEVTPIHKKNQKLIIQIIDQYPFDLILKRLQKRQSNFLSINNLIYSFHFGFRPKYSTNHALINLTEINRQS